MKSRKIDNHLKQNSHLMYQYYMIMKSYTMWYMWYVYIILMIFITVDICQSSCNCWWCWHLQFFFFLHFAFYFESILSFISIYNSHSFFYLCILHFDIYITGDIKWMHRYFFHIFCRLCAQFLVHCNVYENLLTAFEDHYQTNVPYLMHASYLEN